MSACPECNGIGYQPLIGCPGALGRCAACERLTKRAIRAASEIIIASFASADNKRNEAFIAEASGIIGRELMKSGLVVTRTSSTSPASPLK